MKLIDTKTKNNVLKSMMNILDKKREAIINANQKDLKAFGESEGAMYDLSLIHI